MIGKSELVQTSAKGTCILHIGVEKTGTTSIQKFIYQNEVRLKKGGLCLLHGFQKNNNLEFVQYFKLSLDDWAASKGIQNQKQKRKYFLTFKGKFLAELERAPTSNFLITSEHFSSRLTNPAELRELKGFLDQYFSEVKVLGWFRPQWEMIPSSWSTGIKAGMTASLEEYLESASPSDPYFDHYQTAELWSEVFGLENCHFRIYEGFKSVDNDVRLDLLEALRVLNFAYDFREFDFSSVRENTSLSLFDAELRRLVNSSVPRWQIKNRRRLPGKANAAISTRLEGLVPPVPIVISEDQARKIEQRFKKSNELLYQKYFSGRSFSSVIPGAQDILLPAAKIREMIINIASTLLDVSPPKSTAALVDADADVLRDAALRALEGGHLSESQALSLLKIAQRARPTGPLIRSTIEDLELKISANLGK